MGLRDEGGLFLWQNGASVLQGGQGGKEQEHLSFELDKVLKR